MSIAGVAEQPLDIAVVGTGISALSAAWMLARRHNVTVFEAEDRIGGHSNTIDAEGTPVDTGFIVYNDTTYPNLSALFHLLEVPTKPSTMSFAVSMDDGALEYSGSNLAGLFAQRSNIASPRFWSMLRDTWRFYRRAPGKVREIGAGASLHDYLEADGFGMAFREDHLYPMAAAIWSTPALEVGSYPAAAFVRFCENHGLLKLFRRPSWRTVDGGSRAYVDRLAAPFRDRIRTRAPVTSIRRIDGRVEIGTPGAETQRFDHVVIGAHADQALRMLVDPTHTETDLLSAFPYGRNETVLHRDPALMPHRRRVWSSWNYLARSNRPGAPLSKPCVTYWMNSLQGIDPANPLFVTLSPLRDPAPGTVLWSGTYEHPIFDTRTFEAQARLWTFQGHRNTWFCGAYFGAGFHEDGLQAGLAVAEALGGEKRPWVVPAESDRIGWRGYSILGPVLEPAAVPA